ncbi:MAG: TPM domain-containing protein [Bacteroidetes bacterium]|nr:MAG: TPM domain-containing protein [Bacteroidota bacterium]
MKKLFWILSIFISVCALGQDIPSRPSPPKLVNDFTRTFLTPDQVQALEQKLVNYDNTTSNQIAIVVVESLGGSSPEDYGNDLGRKWGVGNKSTNNGVVIVVSTGGGQGNRKVAIVPGYGLEGAIPDVTAKAIVDNDIIPNFKQGQYYSGLDRAVDDIIKAADGRYKAPAGYNKKRGFGIGSILFFIIIFIIIASIGRRGGGGKGGMMSRRGYGDFWTGMILGNLLGGGRSGGGSGWSGGGGGWSGGGGGGFGGFGGGGFGGGGSSGSW